jgi:hypothetical protein
VSARVTSSPAPGDAAAAPLNGTTDYLRQARRLRARFASDPDALQSHLKSLARTQNTRHPTSPPTSASTTQHVSVRPIAPASPRHISPVLGIPPDLSARFVQDIESAITTDGGYLRYTSRSRLLARAHRLGIHRFNANLLIASVLNAHRPPTLPSPLAIHLYTPTKNTPSPDNLPRLLTTAALILSAEAALLAAALYFFFLQ